MNDKHDIAESMPDKAGVKAVAVAVAEEDVELTPKEEAAAANHMPPEEHLVKIEEKIEHDAVVANQLPQTEQLTKFEKKLEHDDSGNQPS
jgi:homoserine acetyltransferase